jgi:hypothetical protein
MGDRAQTSARARTLGGLPHAVSASDETAWRSPPSCRIHNARKGASVRQTDRSPQPRGSSLCRSVVTAIGLATLQWALKGMSGEADYVVPLKDRNAPVNPNYLTRRLARCQGRFERMGLSRFLPADLQATCKATLVRLGARQCDADRLLKRMPKGIDLNYDAYEHLTEKRCALQRWEAHLKGIEDPSSAAIEGQQPYLRATMPAMLLERRRTGAVLPPSRARQGAPRSGLGTPQVPCSLVHSNSAVLTGIRVDDSGAASYTLTVTLRSQASPSLPVARTSQVLVEDRKAHG